MNQPALTDNSTLTDVYTVLKSIPARYWTYGNYQRGNYRYCSIGHINRLAGTDPFIDTGLARKLREKSQLIIEPGIHYLVAQDIVNVNDGYVTKYQQSTPKKRVLALLSDMISANIEL